MSTMTPIQIEVLMYCYYMPSPHPRVDVPSIRQALRWLEQNKFAIEIENRGVYELTARGEAHVWQLCNLFLPKTAWVNEAGEVIRKE